jgi:hypothetical protein|nr:MAG TPA: hypothetical protein [Bacteriophage sp.]
MSVRGLENTLRLILSDSYNIPDSEYETLSGMVSNLGIADSDESYGMMYLAYVMARDNITFPIRIKDLRFMWSKEGSVLNFTNILVSFSRNGFVKLAKVDSELVVKATDQLEELVFIFRDVIYLYSLPVFEGVAVRNTPKAVKNFVTNIQKELNDVKIFVELESYDSDDTERVNLIFKKVSDYTLKDKELEELVKKYIKTGERDVVDVESYRDSKSTLFVGIDFRAGTKNFNSVINNIDDLFDDLEMNYVKD